MDSIFTWPARAGRLAVSGRVNRQSAGQRWENFAESFLKRHGLKTLKRNYRCRLGEIDLVMMDGSHIVFVEVRYRRRGEFGSGAETVGYHKQSRITRTAAIFLSRHPRYAAQACRFDVISVGEEQGHTEINWIRDAFQSGSQFN